MENIVAFVAVVGAILITLVYYYFRDMFYKFLSRKIDDLTLKGENKYHLKKEKEQELNKREKL